MKKNIIKILLLGCISSFSFAEESIDLEKRIEHENASNQLEENLILSNVLAKDAKIKGEEALKYLKNTLAFISKLEVDPEFKACVIVGERLKDLDSLKQKAKAMLDKGKITSGQYKNFLKDTNSQKKQLLNRKKSDKC